LLLFSPLRIDGSFDSQFTPLKFLAVLFSDTLLHGFLGLEHYITDTLAKESFGVPYKSDIFDLPTIDKETSKLFFRDDKRNVSDENCCVVVVLADAPFFAFFALMDS